MFLSWKAWQNGTLSSQSHDTSYDTKTRVKVEGSRLLPLNFMRRLTTLSGSRSMDHFDLWTGSTGDVCGGHLRGWPLTAEEMCGTAPKAHVGLDVLVDLWPLSGVTRNDFSFRKHFISFHLIWFDLINVKSFPALTDIRLSWVSYIFKSSRNSLFQFNVLI